MRKIDALRQLQEVDTRTDAAQALRHQLRAEIGNRGTLDAREAEAATARAALHALQTQQRDLELLAEERRAKIVGDERKLYSGRVTSPKELSSLSDEVAQDKRQLDHVESQLLELMERQEADSAHLAGLEAALARATREWSAQQEAARTRLQETETAIHTLEQRRAAASAELDPPALGTYSLLRRQKGGTAVATVQQRTCQACRVSLTPAQEQRARIGNDIVTCHSCGRILYVPLG